MPSTRNNVFTTVRTQGGLFPPSFLQKICEQKSAIEGLTAETYHLVAGRKLNEAINNAWAPVKRNWEAFKVRVADLDETDPAIGLTRDHWLLPLFEELGYGRLQRSTAMAIEDSEYPISHLWENVPIHLTGWQVDTDKRQSGVAGSARMAPHSMLQEFLNRSDDHLWGFVSNGRVLRILRDNLTMTRQAYVEFDLVAMMEGEVYSDFALLWLLCHESRVAGEVPEQCWLERWSQTAEREGTRLLEHLRDGVEQAIQTFGSGFLAHPANQELRRVLRDGELDKQDYYRQILRLVYRLIFLFVAEDRDLLHTSETPAEVKSLYFAHYSTQRIRILAGRRRGTRHGDLWQQLQTLFSVMISDDECPRLGLKPLGSFLWSSDAIPSLVETQLANSDLLEAFRSLAVTRAEGAPRAVDYRNLGAEELGSIYESLLEMHPNLHLGSATFELTVAAGNERKSSGSYYTPKSLVRCLLDSALDPVIQDRLKKVKAPAEREKALLQLKVCDPACGSGHFLIAAAHRIAKHLARVRTEETEPTPEAVRHALRDVVGHCIYGIDINPMAVELCKVSLWMEAIEPGRPLSFLEHRIVCGNSLLGATPDLIARGIPDDAFKAIEGDDNKVCREAKKRNKAEREGQGDMFFDMVSEPKEEYLGLASRVFSIDSVDDSSADGLHRKEDLYRSLKESPEFQNSRFAADAWCAAFVWRKTNGFPYPITEHVFREIADRPVDCQGWMRAEIKRLAKQYRFLHPQIAFPDVFRPTGSLDQAAGIEGKDGFDVILGNPPWERVKLQEKEWFAERVPGIAEAPNAATRRSLINALENDQPEVFRTFKETVREAEGTSTLLRHTGRFPLCGRGDVNLYAVFAELMRDSLNSTGRIGAVLPSGIATDDTTKFFFQDLVQSKMLRSLYDFQSGPGYFGAIAHGTFKFCLLTLGRGNGEFEFAFFLRDVIHLAEKERVFLLSAEDISLLNPNTGTCPIFRTRRDAEITKRVYRRVPVLVRQGDPDVNPWGVSFLRMFDMANDSALFRPRPQLEENGFDLVGNRFVGYGETWLPLYEAKMLDTFDHRHGSYEDAADGERPHMLPETAVTKLSDPSYVPTPYYWVHDQDIGARLGRAGWARHWLLGWRDVTDATNSTRTVISCVVPRAAVSGKFPLILFDGPEVGLIANLSAFVFDYCARQKIGGKSLSMFIVRQLPVLPPELLSRDCAWLGGEPLTVWLRPRVLELSFTAYDLTEFASDLGYSGPPFAWDQGRRFLARCELDAVFFHLYGIPRRDLSYIMETFPIVKRRDEAKYGDYRTKLMILKMYDEMAEATKTGNPYQTHLDPPPGPPADEHGNFLQLPEWLPGQPKPPNWPPHIHPPRECEA